MTDLKPSMARARLAGTAEALALLWQDWKEETNPALKEFLWLSVERCMNRLCELTEKT